MIQIAVVGAGRHSSNNHLPALRAAVQKNPGEFQLSVVCDSNLQKGREAALEFGFAHTCESIHELLEKYSPHAIVAITPVEATADVARRIIPAKIPLLLEKPLGSDLHEGNEILALAEDNGDRVMVSMNRRFDPVVKMAHEILKDKAILHAEALFARKGRRDPRFVQNAGIHALDTLHFLAGSIAGFEIAPFAGNGLVASLVFETNATGAFRVFPFAGYVGEQYNFWGHDFHVHLDVKEMGAGKIRYWEKGQLEMDACPAESAPPFEQNGTLAETETFIRAAGGKAEFGPTPRQVMNAMVLCERMAGMPE